MFRNQFIDYIVEKIQTIESEEDLQEIQGEMVDWLKVNRYNESATYELCNIISRRAFGLGGLDRSVILGQSNTALIKLIQKCREYLGKRG
jgi:hypothetical protein